MSSGSMIGMAQNTCCIIWKQS